VGFWLVFLFTWGLWLWWVDIFLKDELEWQDLLDGLEYGLGVGVGILGNLKSLELEKEKG
jgi:hypothetical protein